ncbi:MAG: hypothetical protein AB8G05_23535 [Oligoflexales bacterium]
MGKLDFRIYNHRIVLIVARKERGISLKNSLERFGCEAIIAMGIYEGIQVIIQEMPHLVLTESSLPDGDAGLLYDRLTQNSKFKNTPILVNVLRKTRKELEAVARRKFAGFFLGVSDPNLIINKVQEVLATHCTLSPYHQDTHHLSFNNGLTVAIDVKILGRVGNFMVSTSPCDLDFSGKWKCFPNSDDLDPIELSLGSNIFYDKQRLNLFPIATIVDRGRAWVDKLPALGTASNLINKRMVIYFHPDSQQGERLKGTLSGYGIKMVSVNKFEDIKPLLEKYRGTIASVVFEHLPESYPLSNLEKEYGSSDSLHRPIFIVASDGKFLQSKGSVWHIRKPFGFMALLSRILASFIDPKELASLIKNTSHKGCEVRFSTSARVLGLDETGGFLSAQFPIHEGAQLSIEHQFFYDLLGTQGRINITGVANASAGLWYLRFTSVAKGLSKSKYLEQVLKELEEYLKETDQTGAF